MTTKLRFILSIALSVGLVFTTGSLVAQTSSQTSAQASSTSKPALISFLFVVSSDKAKVTMPSQTTYKLTILRSDLNQVLVFSDRPERIVHTITAKELQANWKVASNSFKVDPPNAVLSSYETKPVIVILQSMQVNKNDISFTFTTDHPMTARHMKKVTLTIDEIDLQSSSRCAGEVFTFGLEGIEDQKLANETDQNVIDSCGHITYKPGH